jgi:hypothetical protein
MSRLLQDLRGISHTPSEFTNKGRAMKIDPILALREE